MTHQPEEDLGKSLRGISESSRSDNSSVQISLQASKTRKVRLLECWPIFLAQLLMLMYRLFSFMFKGTSSTAAT
ncbi:hypothetical protein FGO68_gene12288 [Halteria grandinella]|uniref:Uncharacterized protein n=1 Tax=Halteria grandinella TaxID=5974 RepID=A0A8J8NW91_HALGN|nr:hypothetical protein FGO68_gene12288 [Halteria grandinella]